MILACGEALIDMLPRTTDRGETAFAPHPGGALFNTAVALGRLGVPTGFVCGISTDMFGDMIVPVLQEAGVDLALAPRLDLPTTLAFVQLTEGQARYAFFDENTALRGLRPVHVEDADAEAYVFGCISLIGTGCAEVYEALARREAPRKVIMLDPNIRPSFIREEGPYRERLDRMIALADIVKLSDEDLHWLCGPGAQDALARALLAKGPRLVCITEGARGVTGYHAGGATFVPAEKAEVVDTVGAGDTFNAGLLAQLRGAGLLTKAALAALTEEQVAAALALGARCAGIVVSRAGANPPWAHEL